MPLRDAAEISADTVLIRYISHIFLIIEASDIAAFIISIY